MMHGKNLLNISLVKYFFLVRKHCMVVDTMTNTNNGIKINAIINPYEL